jgi:hypothetical protein
MASLLSMPIPSKVMGVDGIANFNNLVETNSPLPETRIAHSPTGSKHYYFKYPAGVKIKNSDSELAPGVDVRGEGGMVLAPPSIKPGLGQYEWESEAEIADPPPWLLDMVIDKEGERKPGAEPQADLTLIAKAMAAIPNDVVGWENWNTKGLAIYRATGGSDEGLAIFITWSMKLKIKFDLDRTKDRWNEFHKSPPSEIGAGSIFFWADEAAPGWRGASEAESDTSDNRPITNLNSIYALVKVGDKVIVMNTSADDISFMNVSAFELWFGNCYVTHNEKKMPLGKYWLHHRLRRQYEGLTFSPDRDVPGHYNLWRGFTVEPKPGDCSKFLAHIRDNVCSGDTALSNWVLGWFADIMQKPDKKNGTSLVLRGKQGTGKTIVGKIISSLLGNHYVLVSDPRFITGRFNSHLLSCLLLHADEGFWAGDHAAEGKLKDLITGDHHFIEFKGKEAIRVRNFVRMLVSGNPDWIVPAGHEERRFAVIDVGEAKMQDSEYFAAIEKEADNGGREALLDYLLKFDLKSVNLRKIPLTAALLDQKILSMTAEQKWWFDVLSSGELPGGCAEVGHCPVPVLFDRYIHHASRQGARRRSIETQLGAFLRKHVPELRRLDRQTYKFQGYSGAQDRVGYIYAFPPLAECRKAFADELKQDLNWDDQPEWLIGGLGLPGEFM